MRILLSNDDGIDAPGLAELARKAETLGEVWVVAPDGERSACSHAFTMHSPVRVEERGTRRFAVSGTPADCVYLAVHELLPGPPDLVLSGVNRGGNLGDDVLYSGTVAAAREGYLNGISAVAVSLSMEFPTSRVGPVFSEAATLAVEVAQDLLASQPGEPMLLNLNVPNEPMEKIGGVVVTEMGRRRYAPLADSRKDPRGRKYFWLGGAHERFCGVPGTDGVAVEQGLASLTPLQTNMTATGALPKLSGWSVIKPPEAL